MDTDDEALFEELRTTWEVRDPVPDGLGDRMVVAVAMADLNREYALLTLVEDVETTAVRGDGDTATLQFSDGSSTVLVHVSVGEAGARRVDGWVDAASAVVRIVQGSDDREVSTGEHGRFAFDDVAPGMTRLRIVATDSSGFVNPFETPQFEV